MGRVIDLEEPNENDVGPVDPGGFRSRNVPPLMEEVPETPGARAPVAGLDPNIPCVFTSEALLPKTGTVLEGVDTVLDPVALPKIDDNGAIEAGLGAAAILPLAASLPPNS